MEYVFFLNMETLQQYCAIHFGISFLYFSLDPFCSMGFVLGKAEQTHDILIRMDFILFFPGGSNDVLSLD